VAVEVGDGEAIFVGPDNGLLAPAVSMTGGAGRAVELTAEAYQLAAPGPTFAGRDIFAPAAAYLAQGVDLAELGPAVDPLSLRPGLVPLPRLEGGGLETEVLWVDRFGNVQLNVGPDEVDAMGDRVAVRWGEEFRIANRVDAYEGIGTGQLGLILDSYGLMALALERASAGEQLGLKAGDQVTLKLPGG
jgi:S-adenosylmethionine hydrolase